LIFLIWDFAAVAIEFVFARSPARCVPFGDDTMNAIRCKKAVFDALAQTVLVNWIAEIKIGVAIVLTQWRGRHPELGSGAEVFEDLAPITFIPGAAAVTLIDDDQVEEVWCILFV